ncbi:ankyrin repeat-containing domain protein [Aspergillus karnatakaensis]|uniref:ankyrin repeat domain-containing protein n=1 Tax=Aspergillus karnatakaensis TaxID=1810916 RepID=UPI003CCD77E5
MATLLLLPNELLLDIVSYLDIKDLNNQARTCWQLHHLLNQLLYQHGLELDTPPLVWGAKRQKTETVQRVFQETAPPANMLFDALIEASKRGYVVIARLLLDEGAAPNGGHDGENLRIGNPLYEAACGGHIELAQMLLDAGARLTVLDTAQKGELLAQCIRLHPWLGTESKTPYAKEGSGLQTLYFLLKHGLDVTSSTDIAWVALGNGCTVELISHLIRCGHVPRGSSSDFSELALQAIDCGKAEGDACAALVMTCIELGADPNARGSRGVPLLHRAAELSLAAVVRVLLDAGADVNLQDEHDWTALYYTLSFTAASRADIVEMLLAAGADIATTYQPGGQSIVIKAINMGDRKCVRLLLTSAIERISRLPAGELGMAAAMVGDDSALHRVLEWCEAEELMEFIDREGNDALMLAARHGHSQIVRTLTVEMGIRPAFHRQNQHRDTALHLAMYSGDEATASLLIEKSEDRNLHVRNKTRFTPLALAVQYCPAAVVKLLLERGSNIGFVSCYSECLLHDAVRRGDATIAKLLLDRGASHDKVNALGDTPLSLAIRTERHVLIELFLRSGISIEGRDGRGNTPLMTAVLCQSLKAIKLLVEAGADLNAKCDRGLRDGTTAFRMALECETSHIAQFLLEAGADCTGKTKQGKTLLMRAINQWPSWSGYLQLREQWYGIDLGVLRREDLNELALDMLGMHGSKLDINAIVPGDKNRTALTYAARIGHAGLVRELLRLGADTSHRDADGGTILTWAACGGNPDVLDILVEYGCDLNVLLEVGDKQGNTPLLSAAWRGNIEAAEWLVARGARLGHCNHAGKSAAAQAAQEDHIEMVLWLVRRGVSMTATERKVCYFVNSYDLCGELRNPFETVAEF